jgi:predicted MPP superfamily phosphohydrolase
MIIKRVSLPSPTPERVCIAHVSDLHNKRLPELMEALGAEHPDMVLVSGDVVHSADEWETGIRFLKECALKYFTCCSLGNHEFKYGADFREKIRQTGAVLLDNSYIRKGSFVIGGLTTGFAEASQGTFKRTPMPKTKWLDGFCKQKGYRILLSHHPEYFELLRDRGIDLILSGHAHGGQWRLFGVPVFSPGQGLFPKYVSGFYENKMFVSRGLANTAPVPRFGNPTEMVFLVGNP